MWKRFTRAIKALFGGAVGAIEDPKLILEQNIRELNDKVPELNKNIATVKAGVVVLERQLTKLTADEADLSSKIRAAINQSRDDIAAGFALSLERARGEVVKVKGDLEVAQRAYEKALDVKKVFMRERERKIREAQEALQAYERSKWQAKIADTMSQFEVGGTDQTHTEMVTRLNEKAAKNEAMLDMAVDSVDTSRANLEEEAEKIRASDLVAQFKREMAGTAPAAAEPELKQAPLSTEKEDGATGTATRESAL
jgi:phage shock protein A